MGGLKAGGNGGSPPSERGPTRAGGSHGCVGRCFFWFDVMCFTSWFSLVQTDQNELSDI